MEGEREGEEGLSAATGRKRGCFKVKAVVGFLQKTSTSTGKQLLNNQ